MTAVKTNPTVTQYRDAADWLATLADPTRIAIVKELAAGSKNVTELAKALNVEIVNVSHHLRVLRNGGVARDEKKGRFFIYTLGPGVEVDGRTLLVNHAGSGLCLTIPLD